MAKRYVRKAQEAKANVVTAKATTNKVTIKDSAKVTMEIDVVYERDSKNSHRYVIDEPTGIRFFQRTIYFDKTMEKIPNEILLRVKVANS